MDDLFDICANDNKYNVPDSAETHVEKKVLSLIFESETEFTGNDLSNTSIYLDRKKEKEELKKKILEAKKKLNALNNPGGMKGNPSKRKETAKAMSTKREIFKKEIANHKLRLSEIDIEEDTEGEKRKKQNKEFSVKIITDNGDANNNEVKPVFVGSNGSKEWKSFNPYEENLTF
jgi:hypothetical protein